MAEQHESTGPWEVLEIVGTEEDAAVIAGFLENQGVPVSIESMHSHEFPVSVSALSNVRLEVPAEHLDRARALLAEREAAPLPAETEEPVEE